MAAVVFFYVIRALLNYTVCFFGHIFGIRVEAAIRRGILHKPPRHHLTDRPSDTPRRMNEIGG